MNKSCYANLGIGDIIVLRSGPNVYERRYIVCDFGYYVDVRIPIVRKINRTGYGPLMKFTSNYYCIEEIDQILKKLVS